jgi:hypothetical protein
MSKTISQLPIASTVASADVFPLDQGGLTKQATLSVIADGLPSATGTGGLVRQGYPVFSTGFATTSVNGTSNSGAYTIVGGAAFGASGGGWVSLYGGTNVGSPGLVQIGSNTSALVNIAADGIRLVNNGAALFFTDSGSTSPYMVSAVDGNFYFTGTNAAGAGRVILQCLMRSDTSPFVVYPPLQIGAAGSPIQNVIATAFNHTPAAISANGGVQTLDVTVTGATTNQITLIECPLGMSNNSIVLKANYISVNTVRVYWINPTASPVTLSNANYRIAVINF